MRPAQLPAASCASLEGVETIRASPLTLYHDVSRVRSFGLVPPCFAR